MNNRYTLLILYVLFLCLPSQSFADTGLSRYEIDKNHSFISVYTDKAGLLKRLGHRHIISIRDIEGQVLFHTVKDSSAKLRFSPNDFVIDDPAERTKAGKGFSSEVSDKDAAGTRRNMLSKKLLDSESYPHIKVDISLLSLKEQQAEFLATIDIKGQTFTYKIPGELKMSGNKLNVTAEFVLNHGGIGLKPFSAAAGAVKVAKTLHFKVSLQANRI